MAMQYFWLHIFLINQFEYWKQIEVTEGIAADIKGSKRIFYKKPRKVDSTYHWRGTRWWMSKEFNYYKTQKPAKNNFQGNVYLITNGICMSSCADFVAILSHNNKAQVIGEETGGGYQGNTSGLMPTVPFLNFEMTIPLQKYVNAVDLNKNFGRGTIPDHPIIPGLKDVIQNKDVQMEYAIKLIKGVQ